MSDLSAELRLRPTRIGFLVRPNDIASVRTIMRACACLWGGVYNPIIPVFRTTPEEWKPEKFERLKGKDVAKGYVRFFEPDVYVEAKPGLLEEAGLGALREQHTSTSQVIALNELLRPRDGRQWSEPKFGLSIHDVLHHVYKTEQQFVHRDKRQSILVKANRGNPIAEAVFGAYPSSRDAAYIRQAYTDVYKPESLSATPNTWRLAFLDGATTPLFLTRYGLELRRYWQHSLLLFVFNPARATDLIDLWNLRLEPHPVLPIPIEWFEALSDDIHRLLKAEHRPIVGNPNGMMHNATIEFSRSIAKADAEALVGKLKPGLPSGALVVKLWRNPIWIDHRNDLVFRDGRLRVTAKEHRAELKFGDKDSLSTNFEVLEPDFASRYGQDDHRWVNVLRVSNYGKNPVANVLPFNTFNRAWPRLGRGSDSISVTSEGWVFSQRYKGLSQYLSLLSSENAIATWLSQLGIKAELSEPGHIAKQMLEHLGGLWGVHLLADVSTLKLLNKMAGGLRRKRNQEDTVEENFGLRTAPLKDWSDLMSRRAQAFPPVKLADFTSRNLIRLGLETVCSHCNVTNWNSLTTANYSVTCERCLKQYDFPQASLLAGNRNWTYRVIGPFSVPDYGRGSYSALLCLRILDRFRSSMSNITFATAMKFDFDGTSCEVDFVAWQSNDHIGGEDGRAPSLVIGEAKSFGNDELIKSKDLAKLKTVAAKLPDAIVVIAVLRDHFTVAEKKMLTAFVNWGRRANVYGEPINPVLLMTSHELTAMHHISETWRELGGVHANFTDYDHTRTLLDFADATQQIYLGMPSTGKARAEYWKKRHARRERRKNRQL